MGAAKKTVADLIRELEKYPPNTPVQVDDLLRRFSSPMLRERTDADRLTLVIHSETQFERVEAIDRAFTAYFGLDERGGPTPGLRVVRG